MTSTRPSAWKFKSEPIICTEPRCGTPVADRMADGSIVIMARHHGGKQKHVVVIPAAFDKSTATVSD